MLQNLPCPAHALGVALIHAHEITGKERRLVATRTGADFQDRGASVGGIFRQKRQPQTVLHLRDAGLQRGDFLLGQSLHIGVSQHRLGLGQIGQRPIVGRDLFGHWFQVRVFPCHLRDFRRGGTRV